MEPKRVKLTQKQRDILLNIAGQKEKLKNAFDLLNSQEATVVTLVADTGGIDNLEGLAVTIDGDHLVFAEPEKKADEPAPKKAEKEVKMKKNQ